VYITVNADEPTETTEAPDPPSAELPEFPGETVVAPLPLPKTAPPEEGALTVCPPIMVACPAARVAVDPPAATTTAADPPALEAADATVNVEAPTTTTEVAPPALLFGTTRSGPEAPLVGDEPPLLDPGSAEPGTPEPAAEAGCVAAVDAPCITDTKTPPGSFEVVWLPPEPPCDGSLPPAAVEPPEPPPTAEDAAFPPAAEAGWVAAVDAPCMTDTTTAPGFFDVV